ncbi:MAG: ABC transporter permease subunit [Bacillota bacterium]|jgi:peptide/nickel transport system permease protein|nr:ABC transporter permease subunit [Bacillota bacterium]
MTRKAKFWLGFFVVVAVAASLGPLFVSLFEAPFTSQGMAFGGGGPFNLGYDYIGRAILPQLLAGGRDLLLASLLTAICSRAIGLVVGIYLANRKKCGQLLRFCLDVLLMIPATVVALATYNAFSGSVYAIIPISMVLSLPFTSRYYESNVRPLFSLPFYEYAKLRERSEIKAIFQEILPILSKNIMTDVSSSFIGAIYMISSVSFIGSQADGSSFLWPKMVSENLPGFSLNPWASLSPLMAIVLLSAPLSFFVDSMEMERS